MLLGSREYKNKTKKGKEVEGKKYFGDGEKTVLVNLMALVDSC